MLIKLLKLLCISRSLLVVSAIILCPSVASRLHAQGLSPSECSANAPEIGVALPSGEARSVAANEDLDGDGVSNRLEVCGYTFDANNGDFRGGHCMVVKIGFQLRRN